MQRSFIFIILSLLLPLSGCSNSVEKCVDAQMKAWDEERNIHKVESNKSKNIISYDDFVAAIADHEISSVTIQENQGGRTEFTWLSRENEIFKTVLPDEEKTREIIGLIMMNGVHLIAKPAEEGAIHNSGVPKTRSRAEADARLSCMPSDKR